MSQQNKLLSALVNRMSGVVESNPITGVSTTITESLPDDKKKKAQAVPQKTSSVIQAKASKYDAGEEMRTHGGKMLPFEDVTAAQAVKSAATKMGVNPRLLMSSAWVEGLNKAVLRPDDVSEAYASGVVGKDAEDYPIDGFFNYGVDRFGDNYENLKKYLPKDFNTRFKAFGAVNEKNEKINTAAFRTNEDALIAKSAMLREAQDSVNDYAKKKGIVLDDEAKDYFTLAAYNGGFGNAQTMLNEFMEAKDKSKFITEGHTTRKGVHKNIASRMKNRAIVDELIK